MPERIALLSEADAEVPSELLDTIKARRGGRLVKLDQLLIHSEPVARGWSGMFTALATECELEMRIREIAIVRIGILTRARYPSYQHHRIALRAGLTEAELEGLREWESSSLFDERERAVLAYTDAMTEKVQVPDEVFEALRPYFDHRQLVELTATIAGYNMVARFMEALDLEP